MTLLPNCAADEEHTNVTHSYSTSTTDGHDDDDSPAGSSRALEMKNARPSSAAVVGRARTLACGAFDPTTSSPDPEDNEHSRGRTMAAAAMLPDEHDDFSQLRALLPMLRDIEVERGGGGIEGDGDGEGEGEDAVVGLPLGDVVHRMSVANSPSSSTKKHHRHGHRHRHRHHHHREGRAPVILNDTDSDTSDDTYATSDEYVKLARDIYSLLFYAKPFGLAFFFSLFMFSFQMLMLALILADSIDPTSDNPLHIPAGVNMAVRTSQFLALIVAVATQDDVISSIGALHNGYDVDRSSHGTGSSASGDDELDLDLDDADAINKTGHRCRRRSRDRATYWQWLLSLSCRFSEGALCLVATFVLVVQSEEVVDLFLDFLAVTFISTLDDIAFSLAKDGYFASYLRTQAKKVMDAQIPKAPAKCCQDLLRPLSFLVISASLMGGWGVVVYNQKSGKYLASTEIAVQFGDEFTPTLSYFSGIYVLSDTLTHADRVVYVEKTPDGHTHSAGEDGAPASHFGQAMFAYCKEESAWTFSYAEFPGATIDPCDWHAKSLETFTFDITTVLDGWYVLNEGTLEAIPFQHFSMRQCDGDDCACDESAFGLKCEFEDPCPSLEIDTDQDGGFPSGDWPDEYAILLDDDDRTRVKVYERPVYATESEPGILYVLLFTGRRWIAATSQDLLGNTAEGVTKSDLVKFLKTFHGHWSQYEADYVSDATDVVTPTDAVTPVGLRWYRTKTYNNAVDANRPVPALLLCARCNDIANPCKNKGRCDNETDTCDCPYGTFGTLCQVAGFRQCDSLVAQFGDERSPNLGALSGFYDVGDRSVGGRVIYVERRAGSGMFAYCKKDKYWTFTMWHPDDGVDSLNEKEPCESWTARSIGTQAYDITAVERWFVRRNEDADAGVPFSRFFLTCSDCRITSSGRVCSNAGICGNNECTCDEGRFGMDCKFRTPCQQMQFDLSLPKFPGEWPATYDLLRSGDGGAEVEVYNRPVYVSQTEEGNFYVILFAGRRWVATKSETHRLLDRDHTMEALSDYFTNDFHGYWSQYATEFISEPMNIDSAKNAATPVGMRWYRSKTYSKSPDENRPLETSLLCAFCNDVDYPCNNGGTCDANGACICKYGTFGTQCQINTLCPRFAAQFSDEVIADLGFFSGLYELSEERFHDRPVYTDADHGGMFAYCKTEMAWTFTLSWNSTESVSERDPCQAWVAKSRWSDSFDILETDMQWLARSTVEVSSSDERTTPLLRSSLICSACNFFTERNIERGVCSREGTCQREANCTTAACRARKGCFCNEGRFGMSCEFRSPPPRLKGDWYGANLVFQLLFDGTNGSDVRFFDHPVYVAPREDGSFLAVAFSGLRWISFVWHEDEHDLIGALQTGRPRWGSERFRDVWAVSEAVNIGIETNIVVPSNIRWWQWHQEEETEGFPAILQTNLASFLLLEPCDDVDDPCINLGECKSGICLCRPCTTGSRCEIKGALGCASVCFEEEGVGVAEDSNCACHESCGTCGYGKDPTSADDCLSCANGSPLNPTKGGRCG